MDKEVPRIRGMERRKSLKTAVKRATCSSKMASEPNRRAVSFVRGSEATHGTKFLGCSVFHTPSLMDKADNIPERRVFRF